MLLGILTLFSSLSQKVSEMRFWIDAFREAMDNVNFGKCVFYYLIAECAREGGHRMRQINVW